MENDFIIGAKLDGQSVTLEPGGQFELSGARRAGSATCAQRSRRLTTRTHQVHPWRRCT